MKTKLPIITAIVFATMLFATQTFAAEMRGEFSSKYAGFSYEAAASIEAARTAEKAASAVKITEAEMEPVIVTDGIIEISDEQDVALAGDSTDEFTGEEKLYQALIAREETVIFDKDDFVYDLADNPKAGDDFIQYYFYTFLPSHPELSYVEYGYSNKDIKLFRLSSASSKYYVSEYIPKYGKSGEEKLLEGLANGDDCIQFDYNDFAYTNPTDGNYGKEFYSYFTTLVSQHPEYRVKSVNFRYSQLPSDFYSIVEVSVAYEPEDDGVPGTEKILKGLSKRSTEITFDSNDFVYALPEGATQDDAKAIISDNFGPIYFNLIDTHPELFYMDVTKQFSFAFASSFDGSACYVTGITPRYNEIFSTMSDEDFDDARKFIDDKVEKIINYLEEYADTDFERALLLHDYICLNFEYAEDLAYHDIYTFLSKGTGVCESYSKLYRYVLERMDMNVKYVSSEAMKHMWNAIEIDGKWYNVDITWDDPTSDKQGYARHEYFLISDADFQNPEIYNEKYGQDKDTGELTGYHHDYITEDGISCDTDYSNAFWTARECNNGSNVQAAPIVFDDDNLYYITNTFDYQTQKNLSSIVAHSRTDGTEKLLTSFTDIWRYKNTLYPGAHSGLALANGVLIYNTPTEIRYVLTNGTRDVCLTKIAYDDDKYNKHHKDKFGNIYRFGVSLDGKYYKHEEFYPILDNHDENVLNTGKNNYFSFNKKYDKFDKNNRNKENIEIDYFIADTPDDSDVDERDIVVQICVHTIHDFEIIETHKATYLAKGWLRMKCSVCKIEVTEDTEAPTVTVGDNAHTPNAKDIVSVVQAFVGMGDLAEDTTMDLNESLDFDQDGTFKMHDIFELFRMVKEQKASAE